MSYTPPDEVMALELEHCIESMESLKDRMVARLRSGNWTEAHQEVLRKSLKQILDLELTLFQLK